MNNQSPISAISAKNAGHTVGQSQSVADAVAALEQKIAFSSCIRTLVERVGPAIFAEPDRFRAFLMDAFPGKRREIRALHLAVTEHVAEALLGAAKDDSDIEPKRQFHRLEEQGVAAPLAAWTVNVLTLALGNSTEISHVEDEPEKEAAAGTPVFVPGSTGVGEPGKDADGDGEARPAPEEPQNKRPSYFQDPRKVFLGIGATLALVVLAVLTTPSLRTAAPVVPNGTHDGYRGWTEQLSSAQAGECKTSYKSPFAVFVSDGMISFRSDDREWKGTIDQQTGMVNIVRGHVTIKGPHTGATMSGNVCVTGSFRLVVK